MWQGGVFVPEFVTRVYPYKINYYCPNKNTNAYWVYDESLPLEYGVEFLTAPTNYSLLANSIPGSKVLN